jgi:hypothetical protein
MVVRVYFLGMVCSAAASNVSMTLEGTDFAWFTGSNSALSGKKSKLLYPFCPIFATLTIIKHQNENKPARL